MTYLLRSRGFDVTAFDIGSDAHKYPEIPLCADLNVIHSQDPVLLPFHAEQFDAVLSCGVLEHVDEFSHPGNEIKSLSEINRVLKPGGKFFVYQLPQNLAWQEAVTRNLKRGYFHPRRYTKPEISKMLMGAGFKIKYTRRSNFIPKNLSGLPEKIRNTYSLFSHQIQTLGQLMCMIPIINRIAGVLEITAIKL